MGSGIFFTLFSLYIALLFGEEQTGELSHRRVCVHVLSEHGHSLIPFGVGVALYDRNIFVETPFLLFLVFSHLLTDEVERYSGPRRSVFPEN